MNSYVERVRPALSFVDICVALRNCPDASYCPQIPGNSNRLGRAYVLYDSGRKIVRFDGRAFGEPRTVTETSLPFSNIVVGPAGHAMVTFFANQSFWAIPLEKL